MKLYTAQSLVNEVRRHINIMGYTCFSKVIAPYVRTYVTQTEGNRNQFAFVDETTYNEVVNTAIRARKANPADIEKADKDFALLVQDIEKPSVERIYTLVDVANDSQINSSSAYIWLRNSLKIPDYLPVKFIETNSTRLQVLDADEYKKAIEYVNEYGPKPRPRETSEEKPEIEPESENVEVVKREGTGLGQCRYTSLETIYTALSNKFGFEYHQARTCLNGISDYVPMCKARRGKQYDRFFTIEVAEKILDLIENCDSSKDFVRKAINLYEHSEVQELYSITEVAQSFNYNFKLHDYSPLLVFAYSLGIGGGFKDRSGYLFTAEEKEQFIEAYKQKYSKSEQTKAEPQPKLEPIAQPKTDDGLVHLCISGLDLKLGRVEALKIAQSIMNQLA